MMAKDDADIDRVIKGYERRITGQFKKALKQVKADLADLYEKYGDEAGYTDMLQYNRLTNLEQRIAEELKELTGETIKTTTAGIKDVLSSSFQLTGNTIGSNIGIAIGTLNRSVIDASVLNSLDRITWPNRLKEHVQILNRQVREEITQGLIQGKGYAKIAQGMTEKYGIAANKAIRIARTETGRAQSVGRVIAYEKSESAAERLGIEMERVWVSTGDERTRNSHRPINLQVADAKGFFTFPSGQKTAGPRLSGVAGEDINCRCTTILRIKKL